MIFPTLFFSTSSPAIATLLSLATFAVGYIARPVGAAVFGHYGDRIGRKKALVVTLIMMGAATFVIGLLPTHAQIGSLAPVLLVVLRLVQGFSVGGEYGGAVLMTVEHSGERKGMFGSLVNTGATAGLILANIIFLAIFQLPDDLLMSWGWRIPFLLSGILVVIGLIARLTLEETPDFEEAKEHKAIQERPLVDVLRNHGSTVLLLALGIIASGTAFTMTTVYSLSYGTAVLGLSSSTMLAVLLPATVAILIGLPLFGALADRIGVRKVFLGGAATLVIAPFCWFPLMGSGHYILMLLGFILVFLGYSANYAVVPAYFSQAFPPAVRFTGLSIGLTVGLIASNAIAPSVSSLLENATGGWLGIALYMAIAAMVSFVAALFLRLPDNTSAQDSATTPDAVEAK